MDRLRFIVAYRPQRDVVEGDQLKLRQLSLCGIQPLDVSREHSAKSLMLTAECFRRGAASRKIGYLIPIVPL